MRNKLPRTSISFSDRQKAYLASEAERLGLSQSEIARRMADHFIAAFPAPPPARGKGKGKPDPSPGGAAEPGPP